MSAGCIESKKDAVQDHVSRQQRRPLSLSRGLRQYFEVRLPIWPSVANAHPPRVVQRTQSVPRRGARPVLERMSAYACRHPHTRAVNRVGARLLRYLWRASERGWPHFGVWGFSLVWRSSEPPHLVAGGWAADSHEKRRPFASCMSMLGELEDGGVQLLAQFLLSVRVNCRRGAFVGIQGDSLLDLSSHIPSRFGGLCLQQRACVRACMRILGVVTLATPELLRHVSVCSLRGV